MLDTTTETRRYKVIYAIGDESTTRETVCAVIPGYSTESDIPKMIAIKYLGNRDLAWLVDIRVMERLPAGD